MGCIKYFKNDRGLTLVELVVTLAVSALLAIPIYQSLDQGTIIQRKSLNQADIQEKTQKVLNQIIEGKGVGSSRVGGLRQASQVAIEANKGLAYITVDEGVYRMVTYYIKDQKLYYKKIDFQGTPSVSDSGGESILENLEAFNVSVVNGAYKITVSTGKHLGKGGKSEANLSTIVKTRNRR